MIDLNDDCLSKQVFIIIIFFIIFKTKRFKLRKRDPNKRARVFN